MPISEEKMPRKKKVTVEEQVGEECKDVEQQDMETDESIKSRVFAIFGEGVVFSRRGKWIFVHMDDVTEEYQKKVADAWDPLKFFDPGCPDCKKFLDNGCFIVQEGSSRYALMDIGGGRYETVCLTGKAAMQDAMSY